MKRQPVKHYEVPGLGIELIDILEAKSRVATKPWEFFLWASAMQYIWRYDLKSSPLDDINKAIVYLTWLQRAVAGTKE